MSSGEEQTTGANSFLNNKDPIFMETTLLYSQAELFLNRMFYAVF